MKLRRFLSGSPNHVYQRSLNGSVIFYSLEDCLVYFTVFCTCAVKYGVSTVLFFVLSSVYCSKGLNIYSNGFYLSWIRKNLID